MSALSKGTATISVTTADGAKTASCVVTVVAAVTALEMNSPELTLYVGDITETGYYVDPADTEVEITVGDTSIVTVDLMGSTIMVKGISVGTTTITATAGTKSDSCTVTVLEAPSLSVSVGTVEDLGAYTGSMRVMRINFTLSGMTADTSYEVQLADWPDGLIAANDQNIDDAGNGHIDLIGTVGETYVVKLSITGNDGNEVTSEDIVLVFTEG